MSDLNMAAKSNSIYFCSLVSNKGLTERFAKHHQTLRRPELPGNCDFSQDFLTRKLGEITVFYPVKVRIFINTFEQFLSLKLQISVVDSSFTFFFTLLLFTDAVRTGSSFEYDKIVFGWSISRIAPDVRSSALQIDIRYSWSNFFSKVVQNFVRNPLIDNMTKFG